MTQLVRYEQARTALQQCRKIDDAKEIRDKAEALRAYAVQVADVDMELWTAEIKARASRRIGEISKAMEKMPGPGRGKKNSTAANSFMTKKSTLAAAGLTEQAANRCEKISEIDQEKFDMFIEEQRAKKNPITVKQLLAIVPRTIKKRETIERLDNLAAEEIESPTGEYDVIVIDPPWPIEKIERDCRPNQTVLDYPTMSIEEIGAMELPAAETCHLWIWTTHRFLPDTFGIGKGWGFNYHCAFVWHKPGGFQPVGLPQFNCEFALYFRKGAPIFKSTKALSVCFEAPRGKHSEKPEEFYDMVRRVTAGRRVDIFNRRPIEGFARWGNEA